MNNIQHPDEHSLDGTHKSDDPVSKSIRKLCPGVPIVIVPMKYTFYRKFSYMKWFKCRINIITYITFINKTFISRRFCYRNFAKNTRSSVTYRHICRRYRTIRFCRRTRSYSINRNSSNTKSINFFIS